MDFMPRTLDISDRNDPIRVALSDDEMTDVAPPHELCGFCSTDRAFRRNRGVRHQLGDPRGGTVQPFGDCSSDVPFGYDSDEIGKSVV